MLMYRFMHVTLQVDQGFVGFYVDHPYYNFYHGNFLIHFIL